MRIVTITLPFPPTVNNLFSQTVRGRRFPSKQYKRWRDAAYWIIASAKNKTLGPPYRVAVSLERPDRRPRDADNYLKAILDALVHMRVIVDDSRIDSVTAEWLDRKGRNAIVTIAGGDHINVAGPEVKAPQKPVEPKEADKILEPIMTEHGIKRCHWGREKNKLIILVGTRKFQFALSYAYGIDSFKRSAKTAAKTANEVSK